MQKWQCPINNGSFKALTDQVCIGYVFLKFWKLIIFNDGCSTTVDYAFLVWKNIKELLELNTFNPRTMTIYFWNNWLFKGTYVNYI